MNVEPRGGGLPARFLGCVGLHHHGERGLGSLQFRTRAVELLSLHHRCPHEFVLLLLGLRKHRRHGVDLTLGRAHELGLLDWGHVKLRVSFLLLLVLVVVAARVVPRLLLVVRVALAFFVLWFGPLALLLPGEERHGRGLGHLRAAAATAPVALRAAAGAAAAIDVGIRRHCERSLLLFLPFFLFSFHNWQVAGRSSRSHVAHEVAVASVAAARQRGLTSTRRRLRR
mmetsp:Transcript_77281/g.154877  ORF Transcript_77281/g.154877 Transcript_77281/m.154877 type:complete len:227 (-) Transcript_77281:514-1194(-)